MTDNVLVIAADQTLEFQDKNFTKPKTRQQAFQQLSTLQGGSHKLHSAVILAFKNNHKKITTLAQTVQSVTLTMRPLTTEEINSYLDTEEWLNDHDDRDTNFENLAHEFSGDAVSAWFKKSDKTFSKPEIFTLTKTSEDKEGNPYPRRINTKIRSQYEQPEKPNVKVYKGSREDINDEDFTFDSFDELIQKGSFVEAVIQPSLWFISGKYGVTWRVIQMKVHEMKPIGPPTESVFSDDEDDDEGTLTIVRK